MTDLYVATQGATFDFEGQPVFINAGDIVRAGHPILRGHEYMFEPLTVKWDVERTESRAELAPVNPRKPTTSGARSR